MSIRDFLFIIDIYFHKRIKFWGMFRSPNNAFIHILQLRTRGLNLTIVKKRGFQEFFSWLLWSDKTEVSHFDTRESLCPVLSSYPWTVTWVGESGYVLCRWIVWNNIYKEIEDRGNDLLLTIDRIFGNKEMVIRVSDRFSFKDYLLSFLFT